MTDRLKVLFVVEGFTDIRFVVGLSEVCDLTMLVPAQQYRESGLDERICRSGAKVNVERVEGGRLRYQAASLRRLWKLVKEFDVVLSQEVLRGSLNACLVGRFRGKPVVTYMCIAPVEYWRCRRERGQCGLTRWLIGESAIRLLLWLNGKFATRCIALGPYLYEIASRYFSQIDAGFYYGVDTDLYLPADSSEEIRLRQNLSLPLDKFVIFLSSRMSHEKDPETVLRATALARARGLDAVLVNLGGGYRDFLSLAKRLCVFNADEWVLGRSAVNPMSGLADYYRACDCVAQASLAEGAGMSPLEALACGTPVVCTAVGGLALIPKGYARLTPRSDPNAMAEEFLWIAANRAEAREQALSGREFVKREWERTKAFASLRATLTDAACQFNPQLKIQISEADAGPA